MSINVVSIVVVGAGGHGREVADVALAAGLELVGFLDDGDPDVALLERRGAVLLGGVELVAELDHQVLLGIGDGAARARLDERLVALGLASPVVVHPQASTGTDVELGPGTVLAAGARVTTHVVVGRHGYVGPNATLGHDTVLGDCVTVLPGATVSGSVTLGAGASIGTGANVLQGLTVGAAAMVGAGSVVTRDVAAGVTVVGVPAAPLAR